MSPAPGARLGPYEILTLIGSGGMGEVYRARDTKLGRDVALKILPDSFTHDPERLARFRREAQVLALLNHPHVGAIYGLDEANGQQFLVLELVDGESLADRIKRGPFPLDEALTIAKQIAEALEAAHEKGIIHRDLKPANIALTPDYQVKVLDFGLAKAIEPIVSGDVTNSPTLTSPAMMTGAGVILGTAAYMSPEQAKGRAADKRSDVWAFGCVLYEMLTGKRAFAGEDVSETLATVLKSEPDWKALSAETPTPIRRLLRRCLVKDRKGRLDSAADARLEIDDALTTPLIDASATSTGIQRPTWQRALPRIVVSALVVGLVLALWAPWRKTSAPSPLRLSTELGADVSLVIGPWTTAILSPDGAVLVFVAQKNAGGTTQLYVRRLEQLQAAPLSETEGAASPFFSPDGQWVAFFADGKLKKISVTGGAPVTLCDAPNGRDGTWADDGIIAFVPESRPGQSIWRVSSAGGKPEPLTTLVSGEDTHRGPQVLPGGRGVLYTGGMGGAFEDANLVVQPLPTGAHKVVQRGGYLGQYLPSGHLVYIHEGTLFAAPFDLDRLEVTGPAVPVVEGVTANATSGVAQFAISSHGTLVYLPGQGSGTKAPIHWMDREGHTSALRSMPANWSNPAFAPDGRRLAMDIHDGKQSDVWIYEWARDGLSRLTKDPADDFKPVWTPDGRRIVFASTRADKSTPNLYWQRADGTGDVQRLTTSTNWQLPASWHPSGKFLAFTEQRSPTSIPGIAGVMDLMILPMEGDEASGWKPGTPAVFLHSSFVEIEPMFSPDGRWVAYFSTESGRFQTYVRPFPGPGGKWQISTGGIGVKPLWSRTRPELLYEMGNQQIMVVPYTVDGDSFHAEKPRLWSDGRYMARGGGPTRNIALHPDGDRVALAKAAEAQSDIKHVTLIFNFFDELRRIAPVTKR